MGSHGRDPLEDVVRKELDEKLDPFLLPLLDARDGAARLLRDLPQVYGPESVTAPGKGQRAWELVGLHLRDHGRPYEGIAILAALYRQILAAQQTLKKRVHKGMPLVWMSDIYAQLGFPVLAKRYLMLTLCEDALREAGNISPETTGVYFRLVWAHGVSDTEVRRYASEFWQLQLADPDSAVFPEWLLQNVDQGWMTEVPSTQEAFVYVTNKPHISPDGRWIAYDSNETGRWEVYVAAFPSFGNKRQVSRAGGGQALWRKNGRELFYLSLDGKLMAADVKASSMLKIGPPKVLFQTPVTVNPTIDQYGVTADGQRFIFGEPLETETPITVVLNWTAGLKR